jgi:Kef-type K+ transport system membrane component KefB
MPHGTNRAEPPLMRVALLYVVMMVAAVVLFLVVRNLGADLTAPAPPASAVAAGASTGASAHVLWHLLLALATVVIAGRVVSWLFKLVGQPPVIGEVVAGILLGPSLLGYVSPAAQAYLLPNDVAPFLGMLAQLGVIVYMFLVGLELNGDMLRGHLRTTLTTSHTSIAVPFVLGSAFALYLYPRFSSADVPFTHFALFLGVAMSITAFPVLARILSDQRMTQTRIGALSLTCAAIGDVTAWCLLAFAVGVVNGSAQSAVFVGLFTIAFIALMFLVVKPRFERLAHAANGEQPTQRAVSITLIALLLSSLATEAIGVHAIFGAFLLGAVIPHESVLARSLQKGIIDLVTILFMPAFFAFTGMRTQIGLLSGSYEWLVCLAVIVVAVAGKFGGTAVAARLNGLDIRHSMALGVLMNTRGLMEVIVLNVGLDLGVISPTLFTMLVLMAIVTTLMTIPLLKVVLPAASWRAESAVTGGAARAS